VQDGKKIPRWTPRSRHGQYIGLSPRHASTVPLVLNLLTHRINAQFHCVFDDWFATVDMNPDEIPDFDNDQWTYLFGESHYQYPFDPDDGDIPRLDNEYSDEYYKEVMRKRDQQPHDQPSTQLPPPSPQSQRENQSVATATDNATSEETSAQPVNNAPVEPTVAPTPADQPVQVSWAPDVAPPAPDPPSPHSTIRRSTRSNFGQYKTTQYHDEFNTFFSEPDPTPLGLEFICGIYAASASDPDTMSYQEAMRAPDNFEFKQAASKEIADLVKQGTWKIVNKSDAKTKILPGIWVFRRKRNPGTGAITKYKGRFTVRGDLQEGVFDTFAPVVQWSTIRMLMAISLKYGYHTRSIDFSSAFVQAELKTPVWIHLPRGSYPDQFGDDNESKCLELKKSLYGLSVAPKLWYEHLRDRLLARGFKASKLDPCLFCRNQVAIAVYVDDLIMISKQKKVLDDIVAELRNEFTITDEGTLSTYLGIVIERKGDEFKLSQPELTRKILQATGLTDANANERPATETLGSHLDCDKHNETWEYASVIGMLMYLSTNSRPDIAFAVHQCARFTHDPRAPHSVAVKQIVRYLKGTADKGLTMKLNDKASVDCYVDADFCGGFKKTFDLQDPATAKSRTGYVIYVFGIPICWGSKLQHEVALSTMEAEYVALSQSTREVLALRNLLQEMGIEMAITKDLKFLTKSTVFEDNAGCIITAKAPVMTARSKHYHTKYHFFKHHVRTKKNPDGVLEIEKIDTKKQVADIFTKPLDAVTFKTVRALLMGW
jgi:Reverse transcriptase (RNA-dependent DNA polymerase)